MHIPQCANSTGSTTSAYFESSG